MVLPHQLKRAGTDDPFVIEFTAIAQHFAEPSAQRAGFRAPLIGGGMGVHYLLASIMSGYAPEQMDLDIYFRRPIFWDDAFAVLREETEFGLRAICIAKGSTDEQKVATEARVNNLS